MANGMLCVFRGEMSSLVAQPSASVGIALPSGVGSGMRGDSGTAGGGRMKYNALNDIWILVLQ
ncbi:hypothetical protein M407DRAFT_176306 [Tulasnella calospora MUT 4182]|uniref:Uncharacterized protein n=1 Tax=Tulasnella calospora MUT 4182 TaxID=1051891 RepID=A0A0C3K6T9_9AGAM|nr:hypothetical protein M407DRAFT_176306 [Tulasnella calospora MUT 4182]